MFVSPLPHSYIELITPNDMILGDMPFCIQSGLDEVIRVEPPR